MGVMCISKWMMHFERTLKIYVLEFNSMEGEVMSRKQAKLACVLSYEYLNKYPVLNLNYVFV